MKRTADPSADAEFKHASDTPHFTYDVVCTDAQGAEKWRERVSNLVTTAGKSDLVTQYFTAASYTAGWYMGLLGAGTIAASDTLASHSGWTEMTPYSGNRPAIVFGATFAGSNTANAVTFSINATASVAGAFIASIASGNSGILYSAADFASLRSVAGGDTLSVTPTVSVS